MEQIVKRPTLTEVLVFAGLVMAGAGTRIWFRELPNFAPIAAMSLFAGYFFRSQALALAAPLLAMVLSDAVIGGYEWQMMLVVYAMLALPVAFRGPLRRWLRMEQGELASTLSATAGLFGCSLLSSVLFYLATNAACWYWSEMYDNNLAGLLRSYQNALPFFRHTIVGDMFFSATLFGGYALAVTFGLARATSHQLASKPAVMPCAQKSL